MTNLVINPIDDLRKLHEQASNAAGSALEYARQAGLLLLAVKKELPHGKFLSWIQSLGFIEVRMAQRYMAAASGKPYTIGGRVVKCDAASYLENTVDEVSSGNWIPQAGNWYFCSEGDSIYWVVPWSQSDNFFHVSRLYSTGEISEQDEDAFEEITRYQGTLSPILGKYVYKHLNIFGLNKPSESHWTQKKKAGVERPFGEPENYHERIMERGRTLFKDINNF